MKMYVSLSSSLQVAQQVDDLRLNRHVERRHRLVGDDQPRVDRERAGDADPLPLTTGELVRIAGGVSRGEAHPRAAARPPDRRPPARARGRAMVSASRSMLPTVSRGFRLE